jgi:hypothetical protein
MVTAPAVEVLRKRRRVGDGDVADMMVSPRPWSLVSAFQNARRSVVKPIVHAVAGFKRS